MNEINNRIEKIIRTAFSRQGSESAQKRYAIYEVARKVLLRSVKDWEPERQNELNRNFDNVVVKLESEFVNQQQPDDLVSQFSPDQASDSLPSNSPDQEATFPVDVNIQEHLYEQPTNEVVAKRPSAVKKFLTWFVIVLGSLLMILSVFYWLYSTDVFNKIGALLENSESGTQNEQQNNSPIEEAANEGVIFIEDFRGDLRNFDPLTENEAQNFELDSKIGTLMASGPVSLIAKDFIPVDIANSYLMQIEFKLGNIPSDKKVGLFAGFATYNKDKKLETEAPGTHRYFVAVNRVPKNASPGDDGWYSVAELITDSGPRFNAFRKTTKFIKPIVFLNFQLPDFKSGIRSIRVLEFK